MEVEPFLRGREGEEKGPGMYLWIELLRDERKRGDSRFSQLPLDVLDYVLAEYLDWYLPTIQNWKGWICLLKTPIQIEPEKNLREQIRSWVWSNVWDDIHLRIGHRIQISRGGDQLVVFHWQTRTRRIYDLTGQLLQIVPDDVPSKLRYMERENSRKELVWLDSYKSSMSVFDQVGDLINSSEPEWLQNRVCLARLIDPALRGIYTYLLAANNDVYVITNQFQVRVYEQGRRLLRVYELSGIIPREFQSDTTYGEIKEFLLDGQGQLLLLSGYALFLFSASGHLLTSLLHSDSMSHMTLSPSGQIFIESLGHILTIC